MLHERLLAFTRNYNSLDTSVTNTHSFRPINVDSVRFPVGQEQFLVRHFVILAARLGSIQHYRALAVIDVQYRIAILQFERHEVLDAQFAEVLHRAQIEHQAIFRVWRYFETYNEKWSMS